MPFCQFAKLWCNPQRPKTRAHQQFDLLWKTGKTYRKSQLCELAMMSKSLCYQKDSITMIYSWKQTRSFIFQEIDREQDQFAGWTCLKVRQIQNYFVKPMFLPKNEQTNSTLLLVVLLSFTFWKRGKTPKRHFEINWPLVVD